MDPSRIKGRDKRQVPPCFALRTVQVVDAQNAGLSPNDVDMA